ncbi:hypothetical protein V1512DRAFT_264072 [Lipomyces arxii]|uniref:uncharacterized protein n=1 Tax=Lipomyces arxii TaxID=56418 RepID=UPI0034CE0626
MSLLRLSTSSTKMAIPLTRIAFRRHLQTHPHATVAVPHFDASALPKWRRHGLGENNTSISESEFLSSIFDSENPPSKDELAKALGQAKVGSTSPVAQEKTVAAPSSAPEKKTYRKFKPRKAALSLTPNALAHIRDLLNKPEPKLLRIGVRNRGCSGLQYHLEYVDKPGKFDEEVIQDGVKVLIDSKALFSIIGSEMDWVDEKLSNRFVFHNPNIKGECGCGESFMV